VCASWRLDDVLVCLDRLPFGAFVEIEFTAAVGEEAAAAALERAIALLGLQRAPRVQASYARLQQEWDEHKEWPR
jgi:adenylate cyclase class IV